MLTIPNVTFLDICLAGIGLYLVKQVLIKKNPAPYPPGPTGWPLVGNVSDMPLVKPWLTFTEWGKKYGECLSLLPILCISTHCRWHLAHQDSGTTHHSVELRQGYDGDVGQEELCVF